MPNNKKRLTKHNLLSAVIFLILLLACGKKKPVQSELVFVPSPEIELPDDEDLDDLPEAGEEKNEDY